MYDHTPEEIEDGKRIAQLERENAELREDKARLDWLDTRKRESSFDDLQAVWNDDCRYLREAIDAARSKETAP